MPRNNIRKKYPRKHMRKFRKFAYGSVGAYYAPQVVKELYALKRLINPEFKIIDTSSLALTIPDGVGTIVQLTNLSQGNTNITRVGNGIKIASIYAKAIFCINASATVTQIRYMLVQDKQVNGAIFATADLIESVTDVRSVISPRNIDNTKRFRILHDKLIILNPNISAVVSTCRYIKIYKKLDMHVRYDGNAGDITDLTQSGLFMVFIGNQPTNAPTVNLDVRVRFLDN